MGEGTGKIGRWELQDLATSSRLIRFIVPVHRNIDGTPDLTRPPECGWQPLDGQGNWSRRPCQSCNPDGRLPLHDSGLPEDCHDCGWDFSLGGWLPGGWLP